MKKKNQKLPETGETNTERGFFQKNIKDAPLAKTQKGIKFENFEFSREKIKENASSLSFIIQQKTCYPLVSAHLSPKLRKQNEFSKIDNLLS